MSKTKKFIYSVATLVGSTVGVGLFSLPYIAQRVGFFVVLGYFFVLGIIVTIIHSLFGKLAIITPDYKRLPGFAKFHLGDWGRKIASFCSVLGTFIAILAYIIVGGKFLQELLSPVLNIQWGLFYNLLYFTAGAILIYFGIKAVAQIEFLSLLFLFFASILIFIKCHSIINLEYLLFIPADLSLPDFFLPYGVILFSLWGASLIPEAEELLEKDKDLLKKVIPIATLLPIVIYVFFIYLILGITGPETTQSALTGLRSHLGSGLFSLILSLGVVTTFTSFIAFGLNLKNVFRYDLKLGHTKAWFITCFVPLIVFLLGVRNFITVINISGGIMLGIEGILILLMSQKVQDKKMWPLTLLLILIFTFGIIVETTSLFW